jgi:hypothetical protein
MITVVPTAPRDGETLVIRGPTMKSLVLAAVPAAVLTVTGPLLAYAGTVAVI